jgi:putative holliday junction resolvase
MRYLGVDYGSKRVGLALSDEAGTMGFPHAIVQNTKQLVDEVCALIERERVGAIVIGESENLSGEKNSIAEHAQEFGDALARISKKPIFFESEVFTTAEARRAPDKELKSRALKQHTPVDASAAALILTSYLSRTNHG